MSIILSLLILIVCLSLHASHARPFGVIDKGSSSMQLHFSGEVVEKVKLLDHFNSSVGRETVDDNKISRGGATTQEPKDSIKKLSGHVPTKHLVSVSWRVPVQNPVKGKRTEIFESSSNVNLHNKATSTTEGWRRRALIVESGTHQVKKSVELGKDKAEKEVAVTDDYEPPHQTPPIHNRQT